MELERTAPPRGRRPRNRRALVIAAAADLFHRLGYDQVTMSEVAAAVNVQPSALYRHFPGKQHLLTAVLKAELEPVRRILRDAVTDDLDQIVHGLAGVALDSRRLGRLWHTEARSMPPDERALIFGDFRATAARLAELVRPELDADHADILSWCALSVLYSVSYHGLELPRTRYQQLLGDMARDVLTLVPQKPTGTTRGPGTFTPQSRREKLLNAAISLFGARGYAAVSMEEIGARTGMAGPSIYHHFASKQDLLVAALTRGDEWLRHDMHHALALADDAVDAVLRLLGAYVDFTHEHSDLINIVISDSRHLPEQNRLLAQQRQRDYVGEWQHLLDTVRPELPATEARIRVQAALTVANELARIPHLHGRAETIDTVKQVGATLLLPAHHCVLFKTRLRVRVDRP